MNVLFIHNNFPAQFGSWAQHLAKHRGHQVLSIGGNTSVAVPGVLLHRYQLARGTSNTVHPFAVRFEADCIRAEAAAKVAHDLSSSGFQPDVVVAHIGWGESLLLRDVWPNTKIIAYCEFFYRSHGLDVNFDPEIETHTLQSDMRVRAKNAGTTLALADADFGLSPTQWQRSTFPKHLQSRISMIHDGIDTSEARPRTDASFRLPGTDRVLRTSDEIVTYVNRHLEPMRGLHIFLRALPEIMAARPKAEILIIGSPAGQAYGGALPNGQTWKDRFLVEVTDRIDSARVHWLGRIPKPLYLDALAVSRAHVYLTFPFVLSWSLLEAMSNGCLVIASKTPPVEEVIEHGSNGFLVDFFDHRALAATVIKTLGCPQGAFQAITSAARQTICQRFDRSTVCMPQLVDLIERSSTEY
jgi:glycosyltransferase involved in cell wall biosynthesis